MLLKLIIAAVGWYQTSWHYSISLLPLRPLQPSHTLPRRCHFLALSILRPCFVILSHQTGLVLHCLVSEPEARSNILINRLRCRFDRAAAHQICPLLLGLHKCRRCASQVSCFIGCSSNCLVADDLIKTRSNLEKIYIHLFFFLLCQDELVLPDWLASTIYLQTFTLATSSNFHLLCDLLSTADSLWSQ